MKTDNNPLLKSIGTQLRKSRIINNKTVKEVASTLGITPQAYGNIERGETTICITKFIQLAEYYMITITELIPEECRDFRKD